MKQSRLAVLALAIGAFSFGAGAAAGRLLWECGGLLEKEATCTLAVLPHASVIVCEPPPEMQP